MNNRNKKANTTNKKTINKIKVNKCKFNNQKPKKSITHEFNKYAKARYNINK